MAISNGVPTPTLESLGRQIQELTQQASTLLKQNGHPEPSFAVDGPPAFPMEIDELAATRAQLLEQTKTLHELVRGPTDHICEMANRHVDIEVLHWIVHFEIATHVPVDRAISYADLAEAARVPERQLRQIVRYATTVRVFEESSPGMVSHTAVSRVLVDNPRVLHFVDYCVDFSASLVRQITRATEVFKGSEEPNETAFSLSQDTQLSLFPWLAEHPETAARFKKLMLGLTASEKYNPKHLANNYDWNALGDGTVVDVGGSAGHCSMAIAKVAPKLKFIVQDLPHTVASNAGTLPPELSERITFMGHDFFQPQPVKGADVYLFSQILHDWSDAYCVKILQQLVPAMNRGSKIVLRDQVAPPPGTFEKWIEKEMRMVDITMLGNFNAQERELEDWAKLFQRADPRLRLVKHVKPPTSVMSIIEVELVDETANAEPQQ